MGNHLYYGDNLSVLRESIADESVDLENHGEAEANGIYESADFLVHRPCCA